MRIIGLTGGIASGKSTVSKYLAACGVPVIDCDRLARVVVEPGKPALRRIAECFGRDVIRPEDGSLDRARLGAIVFADPKKRALLNKITHPAIRREIIARVVDYWICAYPMVVIDAPLLIESGLHNYMGEVIVVYCSQELQLARLKARDGLSEADALARIAAQDALDSKIRLATIVIDNCGSLAALQIQVEGLMARLMPSPLRTWFWLACAPVSLFSICCILFWNLHKLANYYYYSGSPLPPQ